MEKNLKVSTLLDFYTALLTENQRQVLNLYYNEDFSLSEIAQNLKITRQGVHDTIKKAEGQLFELESKLGLSKKFDDIEKNLSLIIKNPDDLLSLSESDFNKVKYFAISIKNIAESIYKAQ